MKSSLIIGAVMLAATTNTSAATEAGDTACLKQAEAEYRVPAGLLAVMKTNELPPDDLKRLSAPFRDLYGPMGLHITAITFAARGMQVPESTIMNERCPNIRASAWLLMNPYRGSSETDIFTAVNHYYYGLNAKETGKMTKLIKRRYLAEKEKNSWPQ